MCTAIAEVDQASPSRKRPRRGTTAMRRASSKEGARTEDAAVRAAAASAAPDSSTRVGLAVGRGGGAEAALAAGDPDGGAGAAIEAGRRSGSVSSVSSASASSDASTTRSMASLSMPSAAVGGIKNNTTTSNKPRKLSTRAEMMAAVAEADSPGAPAPPIREVTTDMVHDLLTRLPAEGTTTTSMVGAGQAPGLQPSFTFKGAGSSRLSAASAADQFVSQHVSSSGSRQHANHHHLHGNQHQIHQQVDLSRHHHQFQAQQQMQHSPILPPQHHAQEAALALDAFRSTASGTFRLGSTLASIEEELRDNQRPSQDLSLSRKRPFEMTGLRSLAAASPVPPVVTEVDGSLSRSGNIIVGAGTSSGAGVGPDAGTGAGAALPPGKVGVRPASEVPETVRVFRPSTKPAGLRRANKRRAVPVGSGAKALKVPANGTFPVGLPRKLIESLCDGGESLDALQHQKLLDVTTLLQAMGVHVLEPLTLYTKKELFDVMASIAEVWKNSGKAAMKKKINKIRSNARNRKPPRNVLDENERKAIEELEHQIKEREEWENEQRRLLKLQNDQPSGRKAPAASNPAPAPASGS